MALIDQFIWKILFGSLEMSVGISKVLFDHLRKFPYIDIIAYLY